MIHRILTPLDKSAYTKSAVRYTCEIAKKFNAEVAGMVVLDTPEIDNSIGPIAPGGVKLAERLESKKLSEAQTYIDTLLNDIAAECEKEGISHIEEEFQGNPSTGIIEESNFYDLVIMGLRTNYHFETDGNHEDTLDKVLNHTITPILAVPENYQPIKNVLIVCDGTLSSVRALQRFAHLAENENYSITLLMHSKEDEFAEYYLNNAEKYLNAYSIDNVTKRWTKDSVLDVIENEYINNTDLIVTGLKSHKSLKEFLLGSVAFSLIMDGRKALFLAQ